MVRIIRLPTDSRTLATGSTLSLEERGKPMDGFTGRVPMRPRGCATPSWPACHPQISGGPHKAANDNGRAGRLFRFPAVGTPAAERSGRNLSGVTLRRPKKAGNARCFALRDLVHSASLPVGTMAMRAIVPRTSWS